MFEPRPSQQFYVVQREALGKKFVALPALCCFRDQQGDNIIYYCKVKFPKDRIMLEFESKHDGNRFMFATEAEAQREADRLNLSAATISITAKVISDCVGIRVGEQYFVERMSGSGDEAFIMLIGKDGWYPIKHFELYENDVLIKDIKYRI